MSKFEADYKNQELKSKINEIKLLLLQYNKTNSETSASIQPAVSKYTEKCVVAICVASNYEATTPIDVGDVAE
jgi:hypothetical protein